MRSGLKLALVAVPAGLAVGAGLYLVLRRREPQELPQEPVEDVCKGSPPTPMPGTSKRRLGGSEVTSGMRSAASSILRAHHADPVGTMVPFQDGGSTYYGRIEWHCHTPGGAAKPWGWHRGVSLFG